MNAREVLENAKIQVAELIAIGYDTGGDVGEALRIYQEWYGFDRAYGTPADAETLAKIEDAATILFDREFGG